MKKSNFIKKSLKLGLAGTALAGTLFFPNVVRSKKKYTWGAVSSFDKAGILGRSFSRILKSFLISSRFFKFSDGCYNFFST